MCCIQADMNVETLFKFLRPPNFSIDHDIQHIHMYMLDLYLFPLTRNIAVEVNRRADLGW